MREALLYEQRTGGRIQCHVCQRRCVIPQGKRGYCLTRLNEGGLLYSLVYGKVSSISINPMEKKPVFHFYPGSSWFSLGTLGCNFRCPGCQNWEIAHSRVNGGEIGVREMSPEEVVKLAKRHGCIGISWTFNEPTVWFEFTLDGCRRAKEAGLYTNYVTNGCITEETLDLIGPHLDVFRADVKGFSAETYRRLAHWADVEGVLHSIERAKCRWGMHVEIVTNVTPGYNDDQVELRGIAGWIRDRLGPDTPWHVTRFYPHLDLSHLSPTPLSLLERVRAIGLEEGLHYVYIGNVPGHPGENTYCSGCGALLIRRHVFDVQENRLVDGGCPRCGTRLAGVFARET